MTMSAEMAHSVRSLFSPGVRTYAGPRPYAESDYAFLNRSARPICQQVRETLDDWFGRAPEFARPSIRARFASSDPGHHLGALLELYLHESFRRLEYEIDVDIGREDPGHRRPDFLLTKDDSSFYLEASAVLGADVLGDRPKEQRHHVRPVQLPDSASEALNRIQSTSAQGSR